MGRTEGRGALIAAVTTPLGFFALVALVLDGVLMGLAASDSLSIWVPLGVLALLIVAVFVIVLYRPEALGDPSQMRPMRVSLSFPHEPIEIQLDDDQCWLIVRSLGGKTADPVRPSLVFGQGGWVCYLSGVKPTDSIRLELREEWPVVADQSVCSI
jgi:hypothetical protein